MSFWSRTGDFFTAVGPGNWLLPSIAWGVAKATGDEDLETQTRNDLQAQVQRSKNVAATPVGKAVAQTVAPLHWLYNNVWNRPVSTLEQMNTNVQNGSKGLGSYLDGGEWKTAWDNSNTYSFGQAVTDHASAIKYDLFTADGWSSDPAKEKEYYAKRYNEAKAQAEEPWFITNQYGFDEQVEANDPRLQDPKNNPHQKRVWQDGNLNLSGNPYASIKERKEFYEGTWSGRMTSGTVDFVGNLTADPLNKILPGAGELAKVGRGTLNGADEVRLANTALESGARVGAKDITEGSALDRRIAATRINNFRDNTYKMYDEIDKAGDAASVAKLPTFFNTADGGALASIFARTNSIADPTAKLAARNNIMGAITGDASAIDRLAKEHADLSAELRRMGEAPEAMRAPEPRFDSKNPAEQSAYWMETNRLAEVNAKRARLELQLDSANKLMANVNSYTDRGVLPGFVQAGVAKLRDGRTVVKDSATGRTIHVVNAFDTVRPAYVNLTNVGEGAVQFRNNLNRMAGTTKEDVDRWVNGFLDAPTREARQSVIHQANESMYEQAARKHGVMREVQSPSGATALVPDTQKIEQIMEVASKVSADVRRQLQTGARLYSAAEGRTATVIALNGEAITYDKPLLNTMLEDATHMPDADLIDATVKALKDVDLSKGAGDAYATKVMAKKALDTVTNLWSTAMLLRPAYGIRVAADDQARTLALLGGHVYVQTALEGLKNVLGNWRRYAYADVQMAAAEQARIQYQIDHLNHEIGQIRNAGPTWQTQAPKVSRADFEATPETLFHGSTKMPKRFENEGGSRGVYLSGSEQAAKRWATNTPGGWERAGGTVEEARNALRSAARAKRAIQVRRGGDWKTVRFNDVKSADIQAGNVRFRPASGTARTTATTVYGKPLDLREWSLVPDDLKQVMGWDKDGGQAAWKAWIDGKGHRADQTILSDYMAYHGYGRAYLGKPAQRNVIGSYKSTEGQSIDTTKWSRMPDEFKAMMGWDKEGGRAAWREWQASGGQVDEALLKQYNDRLGMGFPDRAHRADEGDEIFALPEYTSHGGRDPWQDLHGSRAEARIVHRPDAARAKGIRERQKQINELERQKGLVEAALIRTRNGKLARRRDTPDKQVLGMKPEFHNGHQINPYATKGEADSKLDELFTNGRPSQAYGIELANQMIKDMRASDDYGVVNGGMANWSQSAAAAINQIRKDVVGRRMLAGGELDDVRKFLADDIDARNSWANHAKDERWAGDQNHWLQAQQKHLDNLFPGTAEGTQLLTLARARDVTPDDLLKIFPDAATRPDVHGPLMNPYTPGPGQKVLDFYQKTTGKYFELVADKPSLYGARNRIYSEVYKDELRKALDRYGATADKQVPFEIYRQFQKSADTLAKREVRNTLYDNTSKMDIINKMRYISPFAGATQDVLVKWSRLFYDDPTRLYNYLKPGMATDRDHGSLTAVDDKGNQYFMVPKFVQPLAGAGVSGMNWVVPKGNWNLIFQGEGMSQFMPGFGPLIGIPANELLLHTFPEFGDSAVVKNFLLPYGVKNEDAAGALLPNWWRFTLAAMGVGSADEVNNIRNQILATEQVRYEQGLRKTPPGRDNPDWDREWTNRTRNYFLTRAWDSATSPISRRPQDQYQFYKDTYRQYQQGYEGKTEKGPDGEVKPIDAREKFLTDFPEFGAKTINLSENTSGINPYAEVMDNSRKFSRQIAQDKDMGWAFIGAENLGGTYDNGVYQSQIANGQRRTLGKDEAQDRFDKQMGWVEYTKARMAANMELQRRGLPSLDAKGASGIKKMLSAYVDDELSQQYPAFYEDYNTRSTAGANSFLVFAQDKLIPAVGHNRMDIQLFEQYLSNRRALKQEMERRGLSTLDGKKARGLKEMWDQSVLDLAAQDPGFEQMYSQALQFDNMKGDF